MPLTTNTSSPSLADCSVTFPTYYQNFNKSTNLLSSYKLPEAPKSKGDTGIAEQSKMYLNLDYYSISDYAITQDQTKLPDPPKMMESPKFVSAKQILEEVYNNEDVVTSTSLDILALYLKGQKILYIESKTFCEQKLNWLMLPAIFISAVCAVLNFALNTYEYGSIIISGLNTLNAFLISVINFLKLDAKAEAHKITAYKFQKLESYCEFKSGKILFFKEKKDMTDLGEILKEIETKVLEIKESNQFIIPESVRHRYPNIYSINIFTIVKDIQTQEIILINEFKNGMKKLCEIVNETKLIEYKKIILEHKVFKNKTFFYEVERIENNIKFLESKLEEEKEENSKIEIKKTIFSLKNSLLNFKNKHDIENDIRIDNDEIENIKKEIDGLKYKFKIFENFKDMHLRKAINFRKSFLSIDDKFNEEIDKNIENNTKSCKSCCEWFKS